MKLDNNHFLQIADIAHKYLVDKPDDLVYNKRIPYTIQALQEVLRKENCEIIVRRTNGGYTSLEQLELPEEN
jgi:hypothetical protein